MEKIIILDMGGQYAHLLARRIRQLGVYSEIHPSDTDVERIDGVKGIILSGGPSSVYEKDAPQPHPGLFKEPVPVLGLCYGHHLMARHFRGEVAAGKVKEYGLAELKVIKEEGIFSGLDRQEQVWMSHGDEVKTLPEGFDIIGSTEDCPIAAIADPLRKYYGFQFHPEVTHTPHGMQMLDNFIRITGAKRDFSVGSYRKIIRREIEETVGEKKVFLLVSGGVDSTVCFALLEKVLGRDRVVGLFIDNGLLRKEEGKNVKESLDRLGFRNLQVYDASDLFLAHLEGAHEPEEKRKIIGETFIEVQQKVFVEMGFEEKGWLLAQGTIYPDTIETKGTKNADLIKTHHNRIPLVQKMIDRGQVIEPLKGIYKDEVRELGKELGLPREIVWRHPFPGPGLGVRCLCMKEPVSIDREEKGIVADLAEELQIPMDVLPLKSVGVQGDSRTYRHPVSIEHDLDYDALDDLSRTITNRLKTVNRVLLWLGGRRPPAMSGKVAYLTRERLDLLREADDRVMGLLREHGLYDSIWQFPVIAVPFGAEGESIILRPVTSTEAMTARFGRIDEPVLREMADALLGIQGIDAVFLDITNKPPGTIEWE
ncbi:MAG: glutamine-hydrolyzing GMP synthase, partial [DPANN group archaeon]|nr:glutamine-hydrolyzing GMP synthase [DPANN group archaeon]